VYFDDGFVKTPVYEGLKLENGNELVSPAIIEQPNTTLVVPSGYRMVCDPYSNYILSPLLPLDGSQIELSASAFEKVPTVAAGTTIPGKNPNESSETNASESSQRFRLA